ncbi:MAG TPA: hypothetical protein ENI56_02010 [Candidatus Kaiserbacteria bacterium]|nr:hypothetical protein [Candidatus Kaiserbacteria bacterium]
MPKHPSQTKKSKKKKRKIRSKAQRFSFFITYINGAIVAMAALAIVWTIISISATTVRSNPFVQIITGVQSEQPHILNTIAYAQRMFTLANNPSTFQRAPVMQSTSSIGTSSVPQATPQWPVHTVYPNYGALLPFNRIVSFYGNFYSPKMGILGEYPQKVVLEKLKAQVKKWQIADPNTPVIPAISYIAITAQSSPGKSGLYRLHMPASQIEKAINMANEVHGLVFLNVQIGMSTLKKELPYLAPYLKLPHVELSLDPEFAMKTLHKAPGTIIGTFDASDINFAAQYLAKIVRTEHLPPKILVVHRFTRNMVTNYKKITPLKEVQIVIDMDGWGHTPKKIKIYQYVIYSEPVQFTGFKIFYKNDTREPGWKIMTPAEVLKLRPRPSFIQYQ